MKIISERRLVLAAMGEDKKDQGVKLPEKKFIQSSLRLQRRDVSSPG
jgi:hypothetical protein